MAILGLLAVVIGTAVPNFSAVLTFGAVAGLIVFIGSFASTRFALFMLIFATLLSPEFGSRTTGGGVTVRLDDFLLLVIAFSQLTKAAVNRDIGIFVWTPLNGRLQLSATVAGAILALGTAIKPVDILLLLAISTG